MVGPSSAAIPWDLEETLDRMSRVMEVRYDVTEKEVEDDAANKQVNVREGITLHQHRQVLKVMKLVTVVRKRMAEVAELEEDSGWEAAKEAYGGMKKSLLDLAGQLSGSAHRDVAGEGDNPKKMILEAHKVFCKYLSDAKAKLKRDLDTLADVISRNEEAGPDEDLGDLMLYRSQGGEGPTTLRMYKRMQGEVREEVDTFHNRITSEAGKIQELELDLKALEQDRYRAATERLMEESMLPVATRGTVASATASGGAGTLSYPEMMKDQSHTADDEAVTQYMNCPRGCPWKGVTEGADLGRLTRVLLAQKFHVDSTKNQNDWGQLLLPFGNFFLLVLFCHYLCKQYPHYNDFEQSLD